MDITVWNVENKKFQFWDIFDEILIFRSEISKYRLCFRSFLVEIEIFILNFFGPFSMKFSVSGENFGKMNFFGSFLTVTWFAVIFDEKECCLEINCFKIICWVLKWFNSQCSLWHKYAICFINVPDLKLYFYMSHDHLKFCMISHDCQSCD